MAYIRNDEQIVRTCDDEKDVIIFYGVKFIISDVVGIHYMIDDRLLVFMAIMCFADVGKHVSKIIVDYLTCENEPTIHCKCDLCISHGPTCNCKKKCCMANKSGEGYFGSIQKCDRCVKQVPKSCSTCHQILKNRIKYPNDICCCDDFSKNSNCECVLRKKCNFLKSVSCPRVNIYRTYTCLTRVHYIPTFTPKPDLVNTICASPKQIID